MTPFRPGRVRAASTSADFTVLTPKPQQRHVREAITARALLRGSLFRVIAPLPARGFDICAAHLARHTRCTDSDSMKDSFADDDEVILLENRDVPEAVLTDPFEDAITDEIVMLDLMRLDLADIELL